MAKAKKKTKRAGKKLKCSICGKTFGMPAHLARHRSAIHGAKKKAAKKKAGKKKLAKNGRRKGAKKKAGRPGRPPAIATKLGLKNMSMDDLAALIKAAKQEADRRLREYRELVKK